MNSLLELLDEGASRPTARQIADRAGVSVRSIFQHFADLEGLYADLVRVQSERVQPLIDALDFDGDLPTRIDALVAQRARLFEAITPLRYSMSPVDRQSPAVSTRMQDLAAMLFAQIERLFAPELEGPDRTALAYALDNLTSFEVWDRLRTHHRLDHDEACAVLARSLTLLLD